MNILLRCLFILIFPLSVLVANAQTYNTTRKASSVINCVVYTYDLSIEANLSGQVVNVENNQDVLIRNISPAHPGLELGVVTLPARTYNDEYGVFVNFIGISPDVTGSVDANTLVIPKEIAWFNENAYSKYPVGKLFNVEEYIVENDSKEGLYSEDGILYDKRDENEYPYLAQLPVYAKRINYRIPNDVLIPNNFFTIKLKYPLILSEEILNIETPSLNGYPFYGLQIPEKFRNKGLWVGGNYKTFEGASPFVGTDGLIAATVAKKDEYSLYDLKVFYATSYKLCGQNNNTIYTTNLTYLQFDNDVTPLINKFIPDYILPQDPDEFYFHDRDVITYIEQDLIRDFTMLRGRAEFPGNAVFEPIKNWIYLYPELDHGQWVNNQSQFIYAVCRFGNSKIVKESWSVHDDNRVGVIDQTGIVSLTGRHGTITIVCTLEDQYGATYTAQKKIRVTESGVEDMTSGVEETQVEEEIRTVNGVYNLQGFYLGKSLENLPAGIYIANGKKVVVR